MASETPNNSPPINDIGCQLHVDFAPYLEDQFKLLLKIQQQIFKAMFENWKELSEAQINSTLDFFQFAMDQSLSSRERLGLITEQQLRRLQEVTVFEQSLALDAVEIFQAQSGAMSEQVADLWQSTSNLYN